jgi:predicted methyltransferase
VRIKSSAIRASVAALAGLCLWACAWLPGRTDTSAIIAAAVADPGRPAEDRERDPDRKPAEMMAFTGVRPGDVVADFLPGSGYFTRIFSKVVGPQGKVYAVAPPKNQRGEPSPVQGFAAAYGNVELIPLGNEFKVPGPVDVLWTAQNYHDLYLKSLKVDVPGADRRFFDSVKAGGVFIVVDHVAAAGSPISVADTLHRIDPAIIRKDLEAAGFVFEGELDVLRNPADPHDISVFDPKIRGKTDQVAYKFRKPG